MKSKPLRPCCSTAEKKARALFTYGLPAVCNDDFTKKICSVSHLHCNRFEEPVILCLKTLKTPKNLQKTMKFMKQYQEVCSKRKKLRATLDRRNPSWSYWTYSDGSTKVSWRWMGEVFEESTDDILNNSIVVRNLQELGVDSIEALKYLFPGKTDEERAAMLSGYPSEWSSKHNKVLTVYWITRQPISIATSTDARQTIGI